MLHQGTPPPLFLPAMDHRFEFTSAIESLTVPIRGDFPQASGKTGSFDICPEEGVILFGVLLEVLFAYRTYPKLTPKEGFVVLGLELIDNQISVMGRSVRFYE